ncbi:MAG: hypothetical protein GEU99_23255, partial [Luteitalea sp.]|nr:hypothetical protein [Luteitalea sp.]
MRDILTMVIPRRLVWVVIVCLAILSAALRAQNGDGGTHALEVAAVMASATFPPRHTPEQVLDGDLNTRWSARGDGQWIQFDLGAMYRVTEIKIAWWLGDGHITFFDIETSMDGTSWTPLFTGASSGATRALEAYDVVDSETRYIRIVGHGSNRLDDWIGVTEVEIWGDATNVLLSEAFEDNNFADRGWYDNTSYEVTTAEHAPGEST